MVEAPQKKIRVAVVIPKFGLVGGAEQFAKELSVRIADNPRYEINVFANRWLESGDRIRFHRVPIISFPRSLTTVSFARFAEIEIEKQGPFDIVHTHDRVFKADLFTMHGVPHEFWVREVRKKRMSLFDRATDFVERKLISSGQCFSYAVVSDLVKEKLIEHYPLIEVDKIRVIHPGVDIGRFKRAEKSARDAVRSGFGIRGTDILILFVSMNFELKGLDLLLESLGRLKTKQPGKKFKLLVVGKGNSRAYGRRAEELGVGQDVVFAGVIESLKMPQIYAASDIFSMLSKFDTFGMAALEAMAASVPVLVSSMVGARDLVTDGQNGYVLRHDASPDEVCEKLNLMAVNLGQMAENAFRTAQGHSWQKAADETEKIYLEFLDTKKPD